MTINNPYVPGDPYSYDLKWIVAQIKRLDTTTLSIDQKIKDAVLQALNSYMPVYYATAADLEASTQAAGTLAIIEGFYAAGDGGSNLYYITDDYNDIINADFYLTLTEPNKWALPVLLKEYVTPEMYGAKGDGVTDDTAAFENLIEAQAAGKIILLENNYLISSTLKFPEKTIICGKGKILSNLETAVYIALVGNSAISDISFDGVGVDLCGTNVRADNLYIANSKDRGINVRADVTLPAQNIEILNTRVIDPMSHGFAVQNNTYVSSASRDNAIIDNILFENCSFVSNYNASFNGTWQVGFGILCTASSVKNIVFRDCYASGASESGFHCETAVSAENMVYEHCVSINNGQKANADYGAGFLVPDPDNAKANYYHCFTKGNNRTVKADQIFNTYGELDITDINSGFSVKDMVTSGNGSVLMHGDRIKAYSSRQYTNTSTAAIYRPQYFMSPEQCYTFKNGVYEMFENSNKSAIWCSPLFPINPATQIKLDATLIQDVAVSSSIRFYICFFDGNMNNLGNKYVTVTGMSDNTEYQYTNTFSHSYTNAVYALIEINPKNTSNTSLTTVKNIIVTEV